MPEFFGVDIADIIYSVTKGQLLAGTLIRKTRVGIRNYAFEGAPEDKDEALNAQALSSTTKTTIIIIAKSITPTTVPQHSDILDFNNQRFKILSVETDGAEASHACHVSLL